MGISIGWFATSRPVADLRARLAAREEEARAGDERFKADIRDLAAASERAARADALAEELNTARAALGEAQDSMDRLQPDAAHHAEQKALLLSAQEALRKEFEAAGNRVLDSATAHPMRSAQAPRQRSATAR